MRVFLGGSVLVLLFLAASLWQRSWTSAARAERSAERGDPGAVLSEVPAGWSRVVIGRPSGAEPHRGANPQIPPSDSQVGAQPRPPAPPTPQAPAAPTSSSRVVVQSGQNLTRICREHYGTARAEVVAAVARHNKLASPDALREGQPLELPPLDQLLGKH